MVMKNSVPRRMAQIQIDLQQVEVLLTFHCHQMGEGTNLPIRHAPASVGVGFPNPLGEGKIPIAFAMGSLSSSLFTAPTITHTPDMNVNGT